MCSANTADYLVSLLMTTKKKVITVKSDHPDVKNVDHTFTKVARHERVRFVGNVAVGTDVKVSELRQVNLIIFSSLWVDN
jgi:hypothetical protein